MRKFIVLAVLAACATPAIADVKSGYEMWQRGDYYSAVKEWRPLAIAGDAEAQYNLAQAYKLGRGLPVDLKMAEGWYAKAAAQGNSPARDNYGLILFQNGDRGTAMPYIEESAARGEPRAQYVLGTALFNGDVVKKDWVRAYALMTRASASGISAASASLAQMDKYIPLDQRQRGLTLARTYEEQASRPQLASLGGRGAGRIVTEDLPPSRPVPVTSSSRPTPVTSPPFANPELIGAPPVPAARPIVKPRPAPRPLPVERDVQQITERPIVAPPAPVAGGKWRVQLGAFGDRAKAGALGRSLSSRIAALRPYQMMVVAAGPVSRLQAGPIASRAAAEQVCAAVKAAGQPCLAVAP